MGKTKKKKKDKKFRKGKGSHKSRKLLIIGVVLLSVIIISYFVYTFFFPSGGRGEGNVAILDSLYIMDPNQDFLDKANQTLSSSGFKVDIYLGGNVTVELFRRLPSLGYKLIVLRVHTAYDPELVAFFTGTYADGEYMTEQLMGWVRIGNVTGKRFYAVTPALFQISTGNAMFKGSIVIVDSCFGLNGTSMAEALIEKGASAYIAWNQGVFSKYSDDATIALVENLAKGMSVKQAVENVPDDQDFGSILSFYPSDGENAKLFTIFQKPVTYNGFFQIASALVLTQSKKSLARKRDKLQMN
jgi:hypothetical protein